MNRIQVLIFLPIVLIGIAILVYVATHEQEGMGIVRGRAAGALVGLVMGSLVIVGIVTNHALKIHKNRGVTWGKAISLAIDEAFSESDAGKSKKK